MERMERKEQKVQTLEALSELLAALRSENRQIVHCHGVFDLLHIGHIRYFEQAKQMGHVLVVTITPDRYVNKGPHRPVFNENLRVEAVAALECVDFVALNRWPMAVEAIHMLCPHFYVKGPDYKDFEKDKTGGILLEEEAIKSVGGELVFTDDITFSSSNLINRHMSVFPQEVIDYLASFSVRYSAENVLHYLNQARSLKTLVIGETIIDEYQYCETMGKSGKEPILAAHYSHAETFAGGILAVANHVAAFSEHVKVVTMLGTIDSHEEFIREKLAPHVEPAFLYMENAPTIVKRRFVEKYPFQKLFEIYVMDGNTNTAERSQELYKTLEEELPKYDVVIVTDYGHGMITPEVVELLCTRAPYLAVNTQTNAGNHGFNLISKYQRADYISISEKEVRLEARDRLKDLRDIVLAVAEKTACDRIMITRGKSGCLCYSKADGFFEVPAFVSHIVDRVGSGDAVLSISALCDAQKPPIEIVGFIANAVGAQAVLTVGNQRPVDRVPLLKHIETLLK